MLLLLLNIAIALGLIVFGSILLLNVLFGPHMRRIRESFANPSLSVLIPARNEEKNIGLCLEAFLDQDYKNYEIFVLDDQSEDKTVDIVTTFVDKHQSVHLISGSPLPKGWLGKNWACMQLSKHARGEILLFADADTRPMPYALRRTVDWMDKYNLGMFSVFPQQITYRFAEKLLVPVIDFILYTLLPLWAIYYLPSSLFAAANGQWIAFRREVYKQIGGHGSVRSEVVEDVEFSRLIKRNKIKTLTASGKGVVYTRMYEHFGDIWEGLSKNFFGLTGNNIAILILVITAMFVTYIVPFLLLLTDQNIVISFIFILLIVLIRLVMAVIFSHNVFIAIILHPVMIFSGIFIALNSFYKTKKGDLTWKGRSIPGKVK